MKYKKAYKYFSKGELAEMFGYSNTASFTNSSAYDRHMVGIEGVIGRLEGMFGKVLRRAIDDLGCSITHYDKKDMKV